MTPFDRITEPTEVDVLVGFFDLTNFMQFAEKPAPLELFELMSGYFAFVGNIIANGNGWLVKAVGDAGLVVFPAEETDAGVRTMLRLKTESDDWLADRGIRSEAVVKLHTGPVACGMVAGLRDVYGYTVNLGAVLPSNGFAMTPQVFRKLSPETRKLFKKHTPPMTYIPVGSPHPPQRIYRGKTTK